MCISLAAFLVRNAQVLGRYLMFFKEIIPSVFLLSLDALDLNGGNREIAD